MMFGLNTSIQDCMEIVVSTVGKEKKFRGIQIGNEDMKLIVYVENIKESTKKATKTNK